MSWVVSLLICLPPIFGWRPERRPGECAVSTDIGPNSHPFHLWSSVTAAHSGYVLYSSLGSFYIPVIILVCVYAKIYSITIKHSRQRLKETERRDHTLSLLSAKPGCESFLQLLFGKKVPFVWGGACTVNELYECLKGALLALLRNSSFISAKQFVELELLEENSDGEEKENNKVCATRT